MAAADHFHVGSGSNHKNEYRPRNPEDSLLYRTIAGHLETFLAHQRERGREVPHFVEREMRAYLSCGVLACGFLRLQCESCGKDRLLPLSCKGRSVCPSCGGRRMVDTAAHLVDRVFPRVPVRQWVLSLPFALRYRLAYDSEMVTAVLGVFIRALFGLYRRMARDYGIDQTQCGAVTFVEIWVGRQSQPPFPCQSASTAFTRQASTDSRSSSPYGLQKTVKSGSWRNSWPSAFPLC